MEALSICTHTDSDMLQVLTTTCVSAPLAWQVLSGVAARRPAASAFHNTRVPLCNKATACHSSHLFEYTVFKALCYISQMTTIFKPDENKLHNIGF